MATRDDQVLQLDDHRTYAPAYIEAVRDSLYELLAQHEAIAENVS